RLDKVRSTGEAVRKRVQQLYDQIEHELRTRKAVGFNFDHVGSLPEADRQRMVNEYIAGRFKADEGLRQAQAAFLVEAPVMGAALDLGHVWLRRAGGLPPEQRRALLLKAEKTFLAVRAVAGKDEGVNVSLGEVYYWLGKQAEGKKVFDEVLAEKKRDP